MSQPKINMRVFVTTMYHELQNDAYNLPQILGKVYKHFGEDPAVELVADILELCRYGVVSREVALEELRSMLFD